MRFPTADARCRQYTGTKSQRSAEHLQQAPLYLSAWEFAVATLDEIQRSFNRLFNLGE